MSRTTQSQIYIYFSNLLDYPTPDLIEQARSCADLLLLDYPESAAKIQGFVVDAEQLSMGRLEEIYTGTFDVNPACYIFAGYMLFGESFNRGKFLVRLKQRYRERNFKIENNELPDHLGVIFKYFAILEPDELLAQNLVEHCLVPVLQNMNDSFKHDLERPNPYAQVLRAILNVIKQVQQSMPATTMPKGVPISM